MSKKTVLFCVNSRGEFGGVERMIVDWLSMIDYSKTDVFLMVRKGDFVDKLKRYEFYERLHFLFTPEINKREIPLLFFIRAILRHRMYTIILLLSWYDAFHWPFFLFARIFSIRVYTTLHSLLWGYSFIEDTHKKWFGLFKGIGIWKLGKKLDLFVRFFLSDKVYVCSPFFKEQILKDSLCNADKIKILYHGVPRSLIEGLKRDVGRKTKDGRVRFVSLVRFTKVKRIDRLLGAFLWLFRRYQDLSDRFELTIAGRGELFEHFKYKINNFPKGLRSRVILMNFVDDVYSLLRESDVCILTSDFEALPIVFIEALASGNVLVYGEYLRLPQFLRPISYIFSKRNIFSVAKTLVDLLSTSEEVLENKRKKATEIAEQYFVLERNVIDFLSSIGIDTVPA